MFYLRGGGMLLALVSLGMLVPQSAVQGNPKRITFYCGTSQGAPATLVRSGNRVVPIIRWTSNTFAESGYSNERRCREVSQRFQTYYDDGTLSFITTGRMNGQNVICVARSHGGPCAGLLFTLRPGVNPTRVINQLFNIRTRASGPLNETTARPYVDFQELLQQVEGTELTP
ncbi:MAG: COP23 domain-containing protein [Gloeomargarita sp. GMQP_bins_120]